MRQPSLETLCLLADTLEVSSDYLLARTDIKRTVKTSDYSESDLAASRGQNRKPFGALNSNILSGLHPAFYFVFSKMDHSYV